MRTGGRRGKREREPKSAARVDLDRAAVGLSEASRNEQADLAPPAAARLPWLEQTMGVPGTYGGLGPGHRDAQGRPGPDLHLDGPPLGEPPRALHPGQEHRPEPDGIHVRHGPVADPDPPGLPPPAELPLD